MTGLHKITGMTLVVITIFSFVKVYNVLISERALREKEIAAIIETNKLQQKIADANLEISKKLENRLAQIHQESSKNTEALNKLIESGNYNNKCIDNKMLETLNERAYK